MKKLEKLILNKKTREDKKIKINNNIDAKINKNNKENN